MGHGAPDRSSPETPAEHGLTTPLLLPGAWTELLPDGTERDLPKARPDDTPVGRPVRLEDGRLISVSIPTNSPYPVVLSVFDAQGELLIERDIHVAERTTPQLIGAYEGKAVVARTSTEGYEQPPMEVGAIDLTTFEETPLGPLGHLRRSRGLRCDHRAGHHLGGRRHGRSGRDRHRRRGHRGAPHRRRGCPLKARVGQS